MPGPEIGFYFSFISPYGYFAAERVEALGDRVGRPIAWRAFYQRGLTVQHLPIREPMALWPIKGDYFRQDLPRTARYFGLPYNPADAVAFQPLNAERAFWILNDVAPEAARGFARRVFQLVFAEARLPESLADVLAVVSEVGGDEALVASAAQTGEGPWKTRLREETDAAAANGVWGTPTFLIDDQLFWGSDRMEQAAEWIERGGW